VPCADYTADETVADVTVRDAGAKDAEAIRRIYNQGIEDRVATLETMLPNDRRTPSVVGSPLCGFQVVGTYHEQGLLDGEGVDVILMEKILLRARRAGSEEGRARAWLQAAQKDEYGLLLEGLQFFKVADHSVGFGARTSMLLDGVEYVRGAPIVQEEDPLADAPEWRSAELVGTRSALRDAICQSRTHVVD
jgi:hypothetical protein